MRVLVTGAGGFIGSHLAADRRARGDEVVALDLHLDRVRALAAPGVTLLEGDVADPALQRRAVEGAEVVFHLAAAHLGAGVGEDEFRRVNVEGVRTLLAACRDAGVRRYVHCSSVGVYGRIDRPPADEDAPCRPDLLYEKSKLAGEEVVLEAVRARGCPAVILRPAWVYGPGCPRTEKLFRSIRKGRFVLAGGGTGLRHGVYIRDMVDAFHLAAVVPGIEGQVLIVADREAVTVRAMAEEIARLTGARTPVSVPLPVLSAAALVAEAVFLPLGKEPPLSRRTLKMFTNNTAFSIERARRVLGYEPRYSLSDGLAETWAVLRAGRFAEVPLPPAGAA